MELMHLGVCTHVDLRPLVIKDKVMGRKRNVWVRGMKPGAEVAGFPCINIVDRYKDVLISIGG